jgi:hypothetical protein
MRTLRTEVVLPLLTAALAFAGCTSQDVSSPTPSGVGRVEAELVTANPIAGPVQVQSTSPGAKLKVKEIIVSIEKVTAHSSTGGWVTISTKPVTVDILQLAKFSADLGFANIPAGKITQVRLYVAEGSSNYVTRDDGVKVDLKVPSGMQSGIKIKGLFDVAGCNLTTVPLEFDGKKSIWVHPTGQGDLWILRPVIRMGKVEATGVGCLPPNNPGTGGTGGGSGSGGTGGGSGSGGTGGGIGGTIGGTGGGTGFPEGPGTGSGGPTSPMGGIGATCTAGTGCLSGVCLNGVCGKGGADAPCGAAGDCASGVCAAGVCAVGGAGGTGSVCTANTQCLSNGCVAGKCGEGGQGQPCAAALDCAIGFTCTAGSCASPIN